MKPRQFKVTSIDGSIVPVYAVWKRTNTLVLSLIKPKGIFRKINRNPKRRLHKPKVTIRSIKDILKQNAGGA